MRSIGSFFAQERGYAFPFMPGKPFQSKLVPFYDFIRECRVKRWSYTQIAQALTEEHGAKISRNAVFSFVRVRAKGRGQFTLPPKEMTVAPPAANNLQAAEFFTHKPENPPIKHESKNRRYPLNF